eukprot:TRINITY_DN2595_c0_g5_i2.p1 TRINITY_DN2595_c0_g5~~TRINITY_DN2595_c0_g5_i2.p1  ORF type:complete len:979 (-),score=298.94 TRINITY_DN2595_c0_g5_i2:380-3316(-)
MLKDKNKSMDLFITVSGYQTIGGSGSVGGGVSNIGSGITGIGIVAAGSGVGPSGLGGSGGGSGGSSGSGTYSSKTFGAHKAVIEVRCPTLLIHCVKKKTIKKQSVVNIEIDEKANITPKSMELLLKYLYSANIQFFGKELFEIVHLMHTAKVYECKSLVDICCCYLFSALNRSNWFQIIKESQRLDMKEAKTACILFAIKFFPELLVEKAGMSAIGFDLFYEVVCHVISDKMMHDIQGFEKTPPASPHSPKQSKASPKTSKGGTTKSENERIQRKKISKQKQQQIILRQKLLMQFNLPLPVSTGIMAAAGTSVTSNNNRFSKAPQEFLDVHMNSNTNNNIINNVNNSNVNNYDIVLPSIKLLTEQAFDEITRDFKRIYDDMHHADGEFMIDGKIILCHTAIVSAHSQLLSKLFAKGPLDVVLPSKYVNDIDSVAWNAFLKFVYYGSHTQINPYTARQLREFSIDFGLVKLLEVCNHKINSGLKADMVIEFLQMIRKVNPTKRKHHEDILNGLENDCFKYIFKNFKYINFSKMRSDDDLKILFYILQTLQSMVKPKPESVDQSPEHQSSSQPKHKRSKSADLNNSDTENDAQQDGGTDSSEVPQLERFGNMSPVKPSGTSSKSATTSPTTTTSPFYLSSSHSSTTIPSSSPSNSPKLHLKRKKSADKKDKKTKVNPTITQHQQNHHQDQDTSTTSSSSSEYLENESDGKDPSPTRRKGKKHRSASEAQSSSMKKLKNFQFFSSSQHPQQQAQQQASNIATSPQKKQDKKSKLFKSPQSHHHSNNTVVIPPPPSHLPPQLFSSPPQQHPPSTPDGQPTKINSSSSSSSPTPSVSNIVIPPPPSVLPPPPPLSQPLTHSSAPPTATHPPIPPPITHPRTFSTSSPSILTTIPPTSSSPNTSTSSLPPLNLVSSHPPPSVSAPNPPTLTKPQPTLQSRVSFYRSGQSPPVSSSSQDTVTKALTPPKIVLPLLHLPPNNNANT